MRTSLTETAQIENWLFRHGEISERLLIEAKVLSNPEMRRNTQWQYHTYELARLYGQEKLHEEIKVVEHRLFPTSKYRSFQHRIRSIFKR